MKKQYRITNTTYDVDTHKPSIVRVAQNMHDTRANAVAVAQKSAFADAAALADSKALAQPFSVSINLNNKPQMDGDPVHAATIMYVNRKGEVHMYAECLVREVEELDNTHTNFLYRGFRIEYDTQDDWCWVFLNDSERNHRWSGRSIEACCDIIDELCNDMLMEVM
jgi:hypothetical protein